MHEGSWGAEGTNQVWMNPETSWTYTHIYPAELYTRDVCTAGHWRNSALGKRIMQQLCRELLLLESSDWQFLITTGAARDYAEIRFLTHNDQFNEIKAIWQTFESTGAITMAQESPPRRDRTPRQRLPRHRPRPMGRRSQRDSPRRHHLQRSTPDRRAFRKRPRYSGQVTGSRRRSGPKVSRR